MPRALIFANGDLSHPALASCIARAGDVIIAADGGARHAHRLGLIPSIIIGDLDSLNQEEVQFFTDQHVQILRFPPAKDETDLELALLHAVQAGYGPIVIVGAFGGRLDQTLGNVALLANPEFNQVDIRLDDGLTEAFFVNGRAVIQGTPGDTVSFIPWGSLVEGVVTGGLLYPLKGEDLLPYHTRSISNQLLEHHASISLAKGLLLCIHIRKN